MKTTPCTEDIRFAFDLAPRCGARTRVNHGAPCKAPAIHGKTRCRMHGGKGSGAAIENKNAWKSGCYSADARRLRLQIKQTFLKSKELIKLIDKLTF